MISASAPLNVGAFFGGRLDEHRSVSLNASGQQANQKSEHPSLSGDGRMVAFASLADNLVPNDRNGFKDIFVRDNQTGAVHRASVSSRGTAGNGTSAEPSLSANGRWVVFSSFVCDLDGDMRPGESRIYLHDCQSGETRCLSRDVAGSCHEPVISADGSHVAFLANSRPGLPTDVYVHDVGSGRNVQVNLAHDGTRLRSLPDAPSLSADGTVVAFAAGESSCKVYLADLRHGLSAAFPIHPTGGRSPSLSADGLRVALQADSYTIGVGLQTDILVHDRSNGQNRSLTSSLKGNSYTPALSGDGRFVSFVSDIVGPGGRALPRQLRVANVEDGSMVLLTPPGVATPPHANAPCISADGAWVAYESGAPNVQGRRVLGVEVMMTRNLASADALQPWPSKDPWASEPPHPGIDKPPPQVIVSDEVVIVNGVRVPRNRARGA
jgi:Tol biopolymer transport system component